MSKLIIVESSDEVTPQTKSSPPITVSLRENAENLQMTIHMLSYHSALGEFPVRALLVFGQLFSPELLFGDMTVGL